MKTQKENIKMKKQMIKLAGVLAVSSICLLSGCKQQQQYDFAEIQVEIVGVYMYEGKWATCTKSKDGVRVQWSGRLGSEGDKFPVLYCPDLDGGTYKLTAR
jgi:hypothetical protein